MRKTKLTPKSAKEKLKAYHGYKDCDFYTDDNNIYLISKDNVMEKAVDVLQELQMRNTEELWTVNN